MLSVSTSGKSRFQGKLDKIFWFIIMILPLVFWLVLNMVPVAVSAETENTEESATVSMVEEDVENKSDSLSLESVLVNYFGIDMISENSGGIIGDTLYGVFGSTGIFPIFTRDSAMIYYMIYFVYVEILHVLIDILVFIPRFAHKILGKAINFGD